MSPAPSIPPLVGACGSFGSGLAVGLSGIPGFRGSGVPVFRRVAFRRAALRRSDVRRFRSSALLFSLPSIAFPNCEGMEVRWRVHQLFSLISCGNGIAVRLGGARLAFTKTVEDFQVIFRIGDGSGLGVGEGEVIRRVVYRNRIGEQPKTDPVHTGTGRQTTTNHSPHQKPRNPDNPPAPDTSHRRICHITV